LAALLPNLSAAQSQPLSIGAFFRQEFNTYQWTWTVDWSRAMPGGARFAGTEYFASSLLALAGGADRWKDDQRLTAQWRLPLGTRVQALTGARIYRYWDRQSGLLNDYSTQQAFVGFEVRPAPHFFLRGEAGPKRDKRFSQKDWGPGWQFLGEIRALPWLEYEQDASVFWQRDRLGPRQNEDLRFLYRLGRVFQPGVADTLDVRWDHNRRDNYMSPKLDLENFAESVLAASNKLHYALNETWRAVWRTEFRQSRVEVRQIESGQVVQRRRRNESDFRNLGRLVGESDRWRGFVELSYRSAATRYRLPVAEQRTPFSSRLAFVAPDNQTRFLALSSRLAGMLSAKDSVTFGAQVSRLQYDTPDTSNFDDHDEFRLDGFFAWKHYLTANLNVALRAGVGLYHLVYIFGERSADNNWNRVVRLSPSVELRPTRGTRLLHRFEVLANYIDYDFEQELEGTRSFVFRRFLAEDSLQIGRDRRYGLLAVLRLQTEENGRLYWDEFAERPLTERVARRVRLLVRRRLGVRSRLDFGFAYYERRERRFKRRSSGAPYLKEPVGTFISRGPIVAFVFWNSSGSSVQLFAQRQKVSPVAGPVYFANTIELAVHWNL